ncbi:MAG: S8 family serine peptidase [Thiomicrospira sp.]|uniref:S8 family serine peptidase n=1 Tax=Thiomicrospira sp. TaxID=935 RepID=UPI0019F67A25|nr:S8 family serine peptidase [Thiomicrospira sp.]MBE0494032.1 S8 family serine peptidase [Thiomicrospira sp.]
MNGWLKVLGWLPGLVLLTGCDIFSSSSGSGSGTPDLVSPAANEPITVINDPLFSYQWYLSNSGSYVLTPTTVATQVGEDISALATGASNQTTNPFDYAQGYTGQGVVVSVIDTGLEIVHEDLYPNVQKNGSYNFGYPFNGLGQYDPTMLLGEDHGTSVAGLVGARGGNGIGMWGVAPGVQLKGFNFLSYQGNDNEFISLGQQSNEVTNNQNIDVFNMSYGSNPVTGGLSEYEKILLEHFEYGATHYRDAKGSIYVKAAGNEYSGGNVFIDQRESWCDAAKLNNITCYNANMEPLNTSPFLIAVGAFNANGQRASYSNTGSALWISAPGGEYGYAYEKDGVVVEAQPAILTTDRSGCNAGYAKSSSFLAFDKGEYQVGNKMLNSECSYTAIFNGTSSATPIVSGVAALLLQANPSLSAREVKHIMAMTARQIKSTDIAQNTLTLNDGFVTLEQGWVENAAARKFSNAFGFGALNVQAAITEALNWKNQNKQLAEPQVIALDKVSYSTDNEIPDASATGRTKSQAVNQSQIVESVLVELTIQELDTNNPIDASDYLMHLVSPSGTTSVIQTPFNAFRSGYDIDNMRLLTHAFYGENLTGNWTLKIWDVNDHQTEDSTPANPIYDNAIKAPGHGKLTDWKLTFYGRAE